MLGFPKRPFSVTRGIRKYVPLSADICHKYCAFAGLNKERTKCLLLLIFHKKYIETNKL